MAKERSAEGPAFLAATLRSADADALSCCAGEVLAQIDRSYGAVGARAEGRSCRGVAGDRARRLQLILYKA